MEKIITFALGKSPATSSLLILQDGNVAKVEGCSGATGVACPLFKITLTTCRVPKNAKL